jgi:hypothetical protein
MNTSGADAADERTSFSVAAILFFSDSLMPG